MTDCSSSRQTQFSEEICFGSIKIERLIGRENYLTWSLAMRSLLEYEELWDCVLNESNAINVQKDQRAKCRIILSVDKALYKHIQTEASANGVWKKLQLLCRDTELKRRINLLRKLCSINLEECESVKDYVEQVSSTSSELTEMGFAVSDVFLGSFLLKGLSEKYESLIKSLGRRDKVLTADEIKIQILKTEKLSNEESRSSSAQPSGTTSYEQTFISGNFKKGTENTWLVDSGASCHMGNNLEFQDFKVFEDEVMIANGNVIKSVGKGNVPVIFSNGDDATVTNVLKVPGLAANLLSIRQIVKTGKQVIFNSSGCKIISDDGLVFATASDIDGAYRLDTKKRCNLTQQNHAKLWHRRFGHINFRDLCKLKNDLVIGVEFSGEFDKCRECVLGKAHRKSFSSSGSKTSEILELIHTDVCGPMQVTSLGGCLYFVTFIDDFSKKVFVYFLKYKNEVVAIFKKFKNYVENQTGKKIRNLRSDNGTEYENKQMDLICEEFGIHHQFSLPYTPEQNGVAERFNRTLVEKCRCMLADSKLSKQFWAEAVNTSCYISNISPHSGLVSTPEEIWSGRKPSVRHLRVFGCTAYIHIPKQKRRKLDLKSEKAIFVGYSSKSKGYRLLNSHRKLVESRDVEFFEDLTEDLGLNLLRESTVSDYQFYTVTMDNVNSAENQVVERIPDDSDTSIVDDHFVSFDENNSEESEQEVDNILETEFEEQHGPEIQLVPEIPATEIPRRSKRLMDKAQQNICMAAVKSIQLKEPRDYKEAVCSSDSELWKKAIDDELNSIIKNGTWREVDIPCDKKLLKCKWVFKIKVDQNGEIDKYKARLVAKGYCQQRGIDYNETFSPVVRYESLKFLLSLAATMNLEIEQMDAVTAFLQGDLNEDIYIAAPDGYPIPEGKALKLEKSLYGLKQSPRMWNQKLTNELKKLGLAQSKFDPCIYHQYIEGKIIIVAIYVDDMLFFSNDSKLMTETKEKLKSVFLMKDLGKASSFLGIHLERSDDCIYISQEKYIRDLLQKFNMNECNPVSTPMDINEKLSKDMGPKTESEKNEMKDIPYLELIGSLLFIANITRPDISYSVNYLSRFNTNPGKKHWIAAKRVLRYLKGTIDWKLTYSAANNNRDIQGYSDSDYANDPDERKSVSGYVFKLGNGAVSWRSKKQATTALSTTDAEYVALSGCCQESIWLQGLFNELIPSAGDVSSIYCDNQGAICLAKNQMYSSRTKHIDVKHHFIRDLIDNGTIKIQYLKSEDMLADLFTKSLPAPRLQKLCKLLGLKSRGDVEDRF